MSRLSEFFALFLGTAFQG